MANGYRGVKGFYIYAFHMYTKLRTGWGDTNWSIVLIGIWYIEFSLSEFLELGPQATATSILKILAPIFIISRSKLPTISCSFQRK